MLSRRSFGIAAVATAALSGAGLMRWFGQEARAEDPGPFEVAYSDEEWRERLVSLGRYALRGVGRPQELFTLDLARPDQAATSRPKQGGATTT